VLGLIVLIMGLQMGLVLFINPEDPFILVGGGE